MSGTLWPVADADTREYWAAIAEHRLLVQRCRSCMRHQYYPRSVCTSCSSMDLELVPAAGTGTVYSYTVARRAAHPDLAERVPYVVALVDLTEGPRMLVNLVGSAPEDVRIGADVAVTFMDVADGVVLPAFEIVEERPVEAPREEGTYV